MTENRRGTGSDLKKVDEHVTTPGEFEEIPELTDEDFARGVWSIGGKPLRRGRPKASGVKEAVNIRLSPEVVAHFRATGPGWQTRINEVLKAHVSASAAKAKRRRA